MTKIVSKSNNKIHIMRVAKYQKEYDEALKNPPLCACGCGEYLKAIKRWKYVGVSKIIQNHCSEEIKLNISESKKYKNLSKETRNRIIKSRKGMFAGKKHPFYGKHHTEETKRKMRENRKGRKHSEETKRKISKSNKGNKLCGNGSRGFDNPNISETIKFQYQNMENIWKLHGKDLCDCCICNLKADNLKEFLMLRGKNGNLKILGGLMYYREEGDEWLTLCRTCYKSVTEIEDVFL